MIVTHDNFYLAMMSQDGWSYIQHYGSPVGFLYLLDNTILVIADFGGSHQCTITGNLRDNVRACLFLMDYPCHTRLKIHAIIEVVTTEDHPWLLAQVAPVNYCAHIEHLLPFHLQAFDWNCPQHIMPRCSTQQMAGYSQNLQQRIHDLEQEDQHPQQQSASEGNS